MKKILLIAAASMILAVPAMAGISTTKHNLGTNGTGTYTTAATNQICIFCHTPHNATTNKPLWNRSTSSATVTYTSPTLDNTVNSTYLSSSDAVAPLCLSCHDGATGLGTTVSQVFGNTALNNWGTKIGSTANLGTDLSNDHPVGMAFNTGIDTNSGIVGLKQPSFAKLRVSGGTNYVDCSSCHEPHGAPGFAKFLRTTMDGSTLCLDCHVK